MSDRNNLKFVRLNFKHSAADNGHEFQVKFLWHVEDLGIRYAYIKRGTPQLNGKVERSNRSDQLLSYKDDVDLEAKLVEWERLYNFAGQDGAFNSKTSYEALREKLQSFQRMSHEYFQLTGTGVVECIIITLS